MPIITDLLDTHIPFLSSVFTQLEEYQLDVSRYYLDHICFRVVENDKYLNLKKELLDFGELLTSSQIAGREISTFKLFEPLQFENREIPLLELPAPKKGSFYPMGYEHVEFVVDGTLEEFINKYPDLNFDKKGLDKKVNPDVKLKLSGAAAKFHLYPLDYVIKYLD